MSEKLIIKYFNGNIQKIEKIQTGDWIDLRAAKDVVLLKDGFEMIPLGVGMKLPEGYEAHIVPRSSTFKKWGIIQTNHMGVIDNSYSGDDDQWMFPAYCLNPTGDLFMNGQPVTLIREGDRICQFRIVKSMPEIEVIEVEHLDAESRGGFGSTGTN